MSGLAAGVNESINPSEETTLDNSFISPEFVDSIELDNEEAVLEPTINPNKQDRMNEIKRIISVSGLDIQLKKEALGTGLALSMDFGSRVLFNIITNLPNLEIAGTTYAIFNGSENDQDIYNEVEAIYKYSDTYFPKKTTTATAAGTINGYTVTSTTKIAFIAEISKDCTFGSIGKTLSDIERSHGLLYAFMDLEKKHGYGLFKNNKNHPISRAINTRATRLSSRIQAEEAKIFNSMSNMHPITVLLTLVAGNKFPGMGVIKGLVSKVLSKVPRLNSKTAALSYLGVRGMSQAYIHSLNTMEGNLNSYYIDGPSGNLECEIRNALESLVKNILGGLVQVSQTIGSIVGNTISAAKTSVEQLRLYTNPTVGLINKHKGNTLHLQLTANPNDNVTSSIVNANGDEKYFKYTGELKDLNLIMQSTTREYIYGSLKGSTIFFTSKFDIPRIKGMLRFIDRYKDNLELEQVDSFMGTVTISRNINDQGLDGGMEGLIEEKKVVIPSHAIIPIIKVSTVDFLQDTGSPVDKNYEIISDWIALDTSFTSGFSEDQELYIYNDSGEFTGAYILTDPTLGVLCSKRVAGGNLGAPALATIESIDKTSANFKYIIKFLSRKYKMDESRTLDALGSKLLTYADNKGIMQTGINAIDFATVLLMLEDFAETEGIGSWSSKQRRKLYDASQRFKKQK